MPIPLRIRFEWDEANEDKLLRCHRVSALEVEQCFRNRHSARREGDRYQLLGRTDAGRMLKLIFIVKAGGWVRVFSARDLEKDEKRLLRGLVGE